MDLFDLLPDITWMMFWDVFDSGELWCVAWYEQLRAALSNIATSTSIEAMSVSGRASLREVLKLM